MERSHHWLGALLSTATVVLVSTIPAGAQVPDISASISGPSPNPAVPGGTSSMSATFSVSSDLGPLEVRIALVNANGQGAVSVDAPNTTSELTSCTVEGGTEAVCDWDAQTADGNQTLAITVAVDPATPAFSGWELQVTAVAPGGSPEALGSTSLYIGNPVGTTTLSGSVITTGGGPVAAACIYVLSATGVFPSLTDDDGQWSVPNLPDDHVFAVGVIPPFVGPFGPCAAEGPPPTSGPGELQPVFVGDIWIDLTDPALVGNQANPFAFAVSQGATTFSDTTAGIEACLTTAPGDVVPRPACVEPTPPVTAPAALPRSDTAAPPQALPSTGAGASASATGTGILLLVAGTIMVRISRRRVAP